MTAPDHTELQSLHGTLAGTEGGLPKASEECADELRRMFRPDAALVVFAFRQEGPRRVPARMAVLDRAGHLMNPYRQALTDLVFLPAEDPDVPLILPVRRFDPLDTARPVDLSTGERYAEALRDGGDALMLDLSTELMFSSSPLLNEGWATAADSRPDRTWVARRVTPDRDIPAVYLEVQDGLPVRLVAGATAPAVRVLLTRSDGQADPAWPLGQRVTLPDGRAGCLLDTAVTEDAELLERLNAQPRTLTKAGGP